MQPGLPGLAPLANRPNELPSPLEYEQAGGRGDHHLHCHGDQGRWGSVGYQQHDQGSNDDLLNDRRHSVQQRGTGRVHLGEISDRQRHRVADQRVGEAIETIGSTGEGVSDLLEACWRAIGKHESHQGWRAG